jgi:hypothetical protein
MKTIKQLADELGVSKDSLRKRISREPLKSMVEPYVTMENNAKYVTNKGVDIIMDSMDKSVDVSMDTARKGMDIPTNSMDKTMDTSMDNMDKLISILQSQLDGKDKQIEELNLRLSEVTELANISQRLHAGTIQQQLTVSSNTENLPNDVTIEDEQSAIYEKKLKDEVQYYENKLDSAYRYIRELEGKQKSGRGFFGLFKQKKSK